MLNYDHVKEAEVNVGSVRCTLSSTIRWLRLHQSVRGIAVAKWKLGSWEVADKIPISYNIGHLSTAEGDTMHPAENISWR